MNRLKNNTPIHQCMKEKIFNLKNRPFASIKASSIPFLPKTHYAMRHCSPKSDNMMPTKITVPCCKQIKNPLWHNPLNSKHYPWLRMNCSFLEHQLYRWWVLGISSKWLSGFLWNLESLAWSDCLRFGL